MAFKARWVRAAAVAALAAVAACDGGGSTATTARDLVIVMVANPDVNLDVGEQAQIVATARSGSGSASVTTWSTSDASVAAVDAHGTVTALREGDVTVTATYRGATGAAQVKVRHKQVAKVVVSPRSVTLGALGDTTRLTASTLDASGAVVTGTAIGFTTPDTQVVSVTGDGRVTARGTGIARVIAQSTGKADTSMVSVVQIVALVALSPTAQTLQAGQSAVLQAAARDSSGAPISGASFAWSSSNPAAVTVDPDGTIHGVGAGSATVVAKGSTGVAGSAAVDVQAVQIASLAVSPASATLAPGATQQLIAVAKDAAGNVLTGRVVTWSTSNAAAATVSPLGVVFAQAAGSATITATSEGKAASAAITVSAPPAPPTTSVPTLASADFESGTVSPYGDPYSDPAMVAVVNDPTGGRGGRVLRLHYANSGGDRNTSIEYYPAAPIRSGSLFFRAYLYVPKPTAAVDAIRKLLYWHNDPHTSSQVIYSILYLQGNMLRYDGGSGAHNASVLVDAGTYNYFDHWVRVEQEVKLNTPGVADGELRVWLDGVLVINKSGCRWLDTAADNLGFYQIGQQVHPMSTDDTYDEYRYFDNVAFSTSRIGP